MSKVSAIWLENKKRLTCFDDGLRKIDLILCYVEDNNEENEETRKIFQTNLEKNGLELEIEPKENSPHGNVYFIKIHVPWKVCLQYAERMKMKMPLREVGNVKKHNYEITAYDSLKELTIKINKYNYFTAEFVRNKMAFFDIKNRNTFFSSVERSRIAHRILTETVFGKKENQLGIDRLLLKDIYHGAFPLHEGSYKDTENNSTNDINVRALLYDKWANWNRLFRKQPLGLVKYYFGDKIGIYFTWLGFYTKALILPSFVGFMCLVYSVSAVWNYPPTLEICNEDYPTYAGNLTMCPLCDKACSYWKLINSCLAARVTYIFDNDSTIFFAIFMSLWATLFLEFWKREQFRLSYEWDLVDYDERRDLIRPEYEARVYRSRLNPVNQQLEPHLDPITRYSRSTFSIVTVLFWIAVVVAAVFAIIVFRLAINAVFAATQPTIASPSELTTVTASMLSVFVILILNKLYEKVALWLTFLELPRTQIDFEDSFALKMFCFQFVNYYSYPLYIAFFKGSFAGYPGNYRYLFGRWRWEECDIGGCMYELTLQLFIIMFAKQAWSNIIEFFYPWALKKYNKLMSKKGSEKNPSAKYQIWDEDYDLYPSKPLDLFSEYLELVIQFGFVTLFVAAFPLAPFLALVNNVIEIRLDANKFLCEYRRPMPQQAADIGVWYHLLEFIGTIAVLTNAFVIAVTSDAVPKLLYYYSRSLEIYGYSTLNGYTLDSLSLFNVSEFEERSVPRNPNPFPEENVTHCRYRGYSDPTASEPRQTKQYWHTMTARLAFIIAMEHVVFFLKKVLDFSIPDRPQSLNKRIKREHFLVQNMLIQAEKEQFRKELEQELAINVKSNCNDS